jgi:hypothetical protein
MCNATRNFQRRGGRPVISSVISTSVVAGGSALIGAVAVGAIGAVFGETVPYWGIFLGAWLGVSFIVEALRAG